MKVLLVADAVGGVFGYAVELSRALAARGVRVVLATEGARLAADQRAAIAAIPGLVHEEGAWRLEWMEEPWADVAASGRWLLAIAERERPDVVHSNAFAHGALPFRAPKVVVGHSCVASWFEAVRGEPAPAPWARYREVVAAGLRGADAIVAPSAWMARALVRHHGPIAPPIVIPNGRDPARFPPGPKEPLVLGAGRLWDEAKNAAALARIAPKLPWPVFIAGETAGPAGAAPPLPGPLPRALPGGEGGSPGGGPADSPLPLAEPLRELGSPGSRPADSPLPLAEPLRELGSPGYRPGDSPLPLAKPGGEGQGEGAAPPTFLGRLPEPALASWLSRAAIFAHPARYEPFGLAVLEAALAGCALVLGDVPSLRERWDGAAAFAPPGDDAAIAAAIRGLAAEPDRRAALAREARARALGLGPAPMAAAYLDLYRALAARRAGASA